MTMEIEFTLSIMKGDGKRVENEEYVEERFYWKTLTKLGSLWWHGRRLDSIPVSETFINTLVS